MRSFGRRAVNEVDGDLRRARSVISTVPVGALAPARRWPTTARRGPSAGNPPRLRSPAISSTRTIRPCASTVRRSRIGLPTSETPPGSARPTRRERRANRRHERRRSRRRQARCRRSRSRSPRPPATSRRPRSSSAASRPCRPSSCRRAWRTRANGRRAAPRPPCRRARGGWPAAGGGAGAAGTERAHLPCRGQPARARRRCRWPPIDFIGAPTLAPSTARRPRGSTRPRASAAAGARSAPGRRR